MEKFELINKLSDNEISIIKRSIESVTNENVDAILSAIVNTVNNLMPQDEKFGCPPAGDGTRKDGQPDRRCGDPNKPKSSVKRKPKAESETKSETKSEPKSESKSVGNKVKEAKTIYKDQDGKSYDSLEELKKGSPGSVYKRVMNVDLSPDEKNTLVNKLQNPKTTTRDGKDYADYAINKNGDIIKNAVRRGDSWREDSEGLVIKGRGGEVISGYSPGRVIGRISGNRLSGAYDTGKWGGTELQNEIDSILGNFSAQEFGCPPAGDGTRKDGQPDRRCGDPNKPKASVKRKPKASAKPKSEPESDKKRSIEKPSDVGKVLEGDMIDFRTGRTDQMLEAHAKSVKDLGQGKDEEMWIREDTRMIDVFVPDKPILQVIGEDRDIYNQLTEESKVGLLRSIKGVPRQGMESQHIVDVEFKDGRRQRARIFDDSTNNGVKYSIVYDWDY